jgi:YVTN family beta-propeller protein
MKRSRFILVALIASACTARPGDAPTASLSERALPTGRLLDPVGRTIDIGNMPLAVTLSPDEKHAAILLSGFRERGLQIVDIAAGKVTQTLPQRGAFLGLAFSPDGKSLYTSGGGRDVIYRYTWDGSRAILADSIMLARFDSIHPRFVGAIAFSTDARRLYVAENRSDSIAVVDLSTGRVDQRIATGHYPYAIIVHPNNDVLVSSWGESSVDVFRPDNNGRLTLAKKITTGRHPSAMILNRSGTRLYAVSSSTDRISVIDPASGATLETLSDAAPSGPSEGSTPDGIALSRDESRLFVAEADNNAVAVFDLSGAITRLIGRIPVLWYPDALALRGDSLLVVNGKGRGAGPNPTNPNGERAGTTNQQQYTLGQLNGALSVISTKQSPAELTQSSARVSRANGWDLTRSKPDHPPFEHVILVIKENRTYDQVLGDEPSGDGDSSLVWYHSDTSPNHRALARRFGLYDRFFTNAEVSSQGWPWTTSAYVTEYTEKTTNMVYRALRPDRDEGDTDAPASGYLWDEATRKKITLRNYGMYAEAIPGSPKKYRATRPGLVQYTNPDYPPFDMTISDQLRVDIWLAEFTDYVKHGNLPKFEIVHLPRDHTAGARPGFCTVLSCFADNDLALGRVIDALSHSPYWRNTAVFVMEDDAQAGPDHFDSHRSVALTISAWNKPGLIHRFVNTTDMLATIEEIIGLEPLSQFDRFGRALRDIWRGKPDLTPYVAIVPSHSIHDVNPPRAVGARESMHFDLSSADRIDDAQFNRLLWRVIKGEHVPYPGTHRGSTLDFVQDR